MNTVERIVAHEITSLLTDWGYDQHFISALFAAEARAAAEEARKARAAAKARREDEADSRIAAGKFSRTANHGTVCPTCFEEKSVSGECGNCD